MRRFLIGLILMLGAAAVPTAHAAQVAGVVVQVSGPMSARSPAGAVKPLQAKSEVESGDTLVTAAGAYALVRFIDNSELALKPGTTVKIEQFSYDEARPDADRAAYTLVKGGLRSITGLLGKRSKEKFAMKTPSATIGIRGTTFFLEYLTGKGDLDASPGLEPGLHVHVGTGGISIVNGVGEFRYDPGQFGFIKDDKTRPVKMFTNPGMRFAPPAAFGDADTLIP
ncbi:FecR domain-containing protein [Duganella sp. BuS-21]|uniref:FecR family protein n=1 Tax=Duganella sp. BuS-21 TaxID=2943848 RepID=UPI0035A73AB1